MRWHFTERYTADLERCTDWQSSNQRSGLLIETAALLYMLFGALVFYLLDADLIDVSKKCLRGKQVLDSVSSPR